MKKTEFGARLRQERERLNLSQTKFAEDCGVKRTAQTTYESGERSPDSEYLRLAGRLGVDIPYLITGVHTFADTLERRVSIRLLSRFGERLGIDVCGRINDIAYEEEFEWAKNNPPQQVGSAFLNIPNERINRAIDIEIDKALSAIGIDQDLLARIIEEIEMVIATRRQLSPAKKAQATAMLYRAFKASGKIDQKMIEETIALAGN